MAKNKTNIVRQSYNNYIYEQTKNIRKNTALKLVKAHTTLGTTKPMHLNTHL